MWLDQFVVVFNEIIWFVFRIYVNIFSFLITQIEGAMVCYLKLLFARVMWYLHFILTSHSSYIAMCNTENGRNHWPLSIWNYIHYSYQWQLHPVLGIYHSEALNLIEVLYNTRKHL